MRCGSGAAESRRRAALAGIAFAQNHLGAMYYNGTGTKRDDTEAVFWFRMAARQAVHSGVISGWCAPSCC